MIERAPEQIVHAPLRSRRTGVLRRLARDKGGNTLMITAAAIIPLTGMVGSGIDLSRMYITKTRMQHACDAGALAGRKAMGGGVWTQNSNFPNATAERFFDANFKSGSYGSAPVSRAFSESSGTVSGTATAVLPMTLMRVMGKNSETLSVACKAEMRLPNTDVMFVLDVTGSMNCVAGNTSCTNNNGVSASGSKLEGLKTATKCFFEIVAKLDTNANCSTGTASGGTSSEVQIRFGFVPYASNVNVGYLLPTQYFANKWNYQSRVQNGTDWTEWGDTYLTAKSNGNCEKPADTATKQYRTGSYDSSRCYVQSRDLVPKWQYKQVSTDVSGFKNGNAWRTAITMPLNNDASARSIPWSGCIEERPTVRTTNYTPIPAKAYDLNIDLKPTSGNSNSLWGFSLPDLIYPRQIKSSFAQANTADIETVDNYYNGFDDYCPASAKLLQSWSSATDFDAYVDSLRGLGNTYHDIGMLWGARLMSPTGIFEAQNATASGGGEIQRHMIFMTDGDSSSNPCDYNAYGVPWFDKRQTTDVGDADDCGTKRQALIDQIDLRLAALCTAVKNKNITLWVVSYGGGLNSTTETRLQNCASPGRYFQATSSSALQTTFANIANQISQLRLTQ